MPNFDLGSDWHLDTRKNAADLLEAIEPTSDTLVLAGDLTTRFYTFNPQWAQLISDKYKQVLYVLGNHEFYDLTIESAARVYKAALPANWTLLDNEFIEIDDVIYAGTTLWYPDQPTNVLHEPFWPDFKFIENAKPTIYDAHEKAKEFLVGTSLPDVWITHHLPFWACVHPKYANDHNNCFYVGDMSKAINKLEKFPSVVVYGHTHEQMDFKLGHMRVVCNPFGYPQEHRQAIVPQRVEW